MYIKKSMLLFITVFIAVFFVYPRPTHAQSQFYKDFLYKFQSRWSDIAVNRTGSRIFIINESYSRIEEYDSGGFLVAIHGSFGTAAGKFNRPQALFIDSTGAVDYLYILDTGNNRVLRYTTLLGTTGSALGTPTAWGSYGTGSNNAFFNNPTGLTGDHDYLYIADTDNNRIQKCTKDGATCVTLGSLGIDNTAGSEMRFSSPKGICLDETTTPYNRVYVADTGNNRVQWFATNSAVLGGSFGSYGSGNKQFILPYRIASESTGTYIYVLDTLNRIQRLYKNTGELESSITLSSFGGGIKTLNGVLYSTSLPTTLQTYDILSNPTLTATATNDVGHPVDVSVDALGNFYINNNFALSVTVTPTPGIPAPSPFPVIQKFNSSFIQTAEWQGGTPAFGISPYGGPMGIGVNSGDDVYVADTDGNAIQKFTSSGTWISTNTGSGILVVPTGFSSPKDVATESTGKFYVADTGKGRIVKFDSNGVYVWSQLLPTIAALTPTPPLGSSPAPYGITVASDNKIYVADAGFHRILRYNANDNGYEASWGQFGSADSSVIPQLDSPQGMAIDTAGNIYVADTGNNRIQRFDQNGTLATRVVWGTYGTQNGNFINPRNVFVDSSSRVYVSEMGDVVGTVPRNRRIQVFGNATASAGLTITQTNGTTVNEGLTKAATVIDSYTIKLKTQPTSTVLVAITASDPDQATVATPTLAFTQYNWNIPQTVTVIPTHDFIADGTHTVTIYHKPSTDAVTGDIYYRNATNVSKADVTVTINDTIDIPRVNLISGYEAADTGEWVIYPDSGSNIVPWATEGATLSNAYTISLNTKPTSSVTITLSPPSTLTLSQNTFTFSPLDYGPQDVELTPVRDYIAQGQGATFPTINHTATALGSTPDLNYSSPNAKFSNDNGNMTVRVQDIDVVGVTLSKTSATVTEGGATDSYTVKLKSKPMDDVKIYPTDASVSASLAALVTLNPTELVFSPTTWDVPQTVTVTAVHDDIKNTPPQRTTDIIHPDTYSLDTFYNNITITQVSTTINDSDTASLLISNPKGGPITVTEGGASGTYVFQLTSIPLSNVYVTSTNADEQATTSAYFYTFTPSDWNVPQYVTVSAVDNYVENSSPTTTISHTLTSSDSNFNTPSSPVNQSVTVIDNDTAGIILTLPDGAINIAEAGPSDSYFLKLNSKPTANVTLTMANQTQADASPAIVTFTPNNWNVNQKVVLTAIQDYIIEGAQTQLISYTSTSGTEVISPGGGSTFVGGDDKYKGKTASFTANIADDDSLYPGVSVVETDGGTTVVKDTTTDTYTLSLTSKPTYTVKIKIVANGPEATTSAGVYWFAPSVWNVPQTVNVSAKTNPSGSKTAIFTHLVTSLDAHYAGISAPTVNVTVKEKSSSSSSGGAVKAPTCGKTPPNNAPNLFQVTTTQTQATLYFTPIRENISYYFIAYGFAPGDYRFGTSFEMGPYDGVIDYTVNMLTPGTKYYFTVRGGNGCATGPWSAAVPATAVGSESSATTTRTYYAPYAAPSASGSTSGSSGGSSPTGGIWLTRDLFPGAQGADVRSLQEYLNAHGFTLATSGAGSPGNETTYYGNLTASAVRRFQEAHFAEILSPLGYASGTGICGSSTRNYINSHP